MSRYPEPDEAQHQHYNDGYLPYPSSATPNPYLPSNTVPNRCDAQQNSYDQLSQQPYAQPGGVTPGASSSRSLYTQDQPDNHDMDAGDMLLRRDPSSNSSIRRVPDGYDDDGGGAVRYGRIPQRVPRRYKTIKKVELDHGNFVVDSAVPTKLLDMGANHTEREFTHMRYSAATCCPNDFIDSGFTLRQVHYDPPRRTELFIAITMYNEDAELFCQTIHGVIKNIAHLCKRDRSKTWGMDGWKKVVVCIVSDGRGKINSRTLSVIAAMGAYQEGVAKTKIGKQDVTAHVYEYTTQISVTPNLKIKGAEQGAVPVQVIFCLKEKNQKKINSHRWFFNAFGAILQPNVCVLLDVGTMPGPTSIYHLWKTFDIKADVGGACGEIVALKGKYGRKLINPLVAAQNFEYKMSNILDKSLESVFGYVTVLPGAFSAYRYIALRNDSTGEGPLQKYFLGETMPGSIFTANMYLAEDRILSWELVAKRGASWTLHYVKSAYAVTDVPDQVPELISQRRRWFNGSFFAGVHSIAHFYYIYRSSHSFARKACIHIQMVYQLCNLILSWFALANYYITFALVSESIEDKSFNLPKWIKTVNVILHYSYLGLLMMCFILGLGNRPQGSKWGYTVAMIGFSVITICVTAAAFFLAFKGIEDLARKDGPVTFRELLMNPILNIMISLLANLGFYIIASIICLDPWHMITSFAQYVILLPSYTNVWNVYAFANVHDISWGTKGDNTIAKDLGTVTTSTTGKKGEVEAELPTDVDVFYENAIYVLNMKSPEVDSKLDEGTQQGDYYRTFRTNVLLAWVLSNGLLAVVITSGAIKAVSVYPTLLLRSVACLTCVRLLGSILYMFFRLFGGEWRRAYC